jgi:hypothetical protein
MKDFQNILEDCLRRLSNGSSTLEECLTLYSEHAGRLEPLLQTAFLLNSGRFVTPASTFDAFAHFAVAQYAQSHPRQKQSAGLAFSWRTVMTLVILVITFLVTGTAHAQSALPGDIDYGWKLKSEMAWRALSTDPVAVDIVLAERRLDEWMKVADDPTLCDAARESYQNALARLQFRDDEEAIALILPVLQAQQQTLEQAGLSVPELDNYLANLPNPALIPVTGAQPTVTVPPSTATEVLATEVPTEIAAGECTSNCVESQSGTTQSKDKDNNKDKDKKEKDKENNGKQDEHENNGKNNP